MPGVKEVSCRFFETPLRDLRDRGIDPRELVAGTPYTPATLADKDERVEWSALVRMMENARRLWTREQLLALGARSTEGPLVQFIAVVARLRFSVQGFYQWVTAPDGVGSQMITCITTRSRVEGPGHIVFEFTMAPNRAVSEEFFLIMQGTYAAMPRMLGAPLAHVVSELHPGGAVFRISYSEPRGVLASVRRAVTWPFTAKQAAEELTTAHASLLERYRQLDAMRAALQRHQADLERQVDERTRELREAQAARERFFGSVSHEIRTPLSLILLAASDIEARAGTALDARSNQSLGSISEGARKLVRLVDELLLLAAGQEGKFKITREVIDLAALLRQIAVAWRPAAEHAALELEVRAPEALLVQVDPVALERVVSNLVSNAVKYTPRGGRVELELADEPAGVRLSVLDTGRGIDDELAGRLFGRFERGVNERMTKGTGIGLSLVKQLVEAHEGTIEARPRHPHGTEMYVIIPRAEIGDAVAPSRDLQLEAPAPVASVTSGMRFEPPGTSAGLIVLAEDNPALAEATARLLAEKYTVIVGLDGEAAFELVLRVHPQMLITDIDMPKLNGIELAKRYRSHTGDRLSPIIILSSVIDLGTRVAGLEAGAIDYVTKPFDPRELMARVDAQFRMRELAKRLQQAEQLSTLGILTSGLAHELRNPANGIVNAMRPLAAMLKPQLADPESGISQLFDVVKQSAGQISFLSRQLLGFQRGQELEVAPTNLTELVERAVTLSSGALSNVELRLQLSVETPVTCSGHLLVQALTNLVENAGHAAGATGWVEVTTRNDNGRVIVEVADSGPGVPVELRERIFEPFFTTKDPGVGTGLGLPISRAIVHRHGGVLELRERVGRPVFVIDMPEIAVAERGPTRYGNRASRT
jgi:signal transduction histidine kinase